MQRLLCLISGMNAGGAETFLMKVYRHMDRTQFQLDFCINEKEKCFYEDEIRALGGRIFRIPSKSENVREFQKQLAAVVRSEKYDRVLRITSNAMGFLDLKIAKQAGARVCCARSSNSSDGTGVKAAVAHRIGRLLYGKYVDVALAPSDLAAMYTFGKKAYRDGRVQILRNAVDLDVFRYDAEARQRIRKELGIAPNTTVIGHVGRFMEQKNHAFLAKIFGEIKTQCRNAVLLLVGDGPLRSTFEQQVTARGIRESVIFAGIRSDIPALLSAMDVFVFPSFYEGMPNTVIEAQATGLPCVITDTITREAAITPLVTYASLEESATAWASAALRSVACLRTDTRSMFEQQGYDIRSATKVFTQIVFQ